MKSKPIHYTYHQIINHRDGGGRRFEPPPPLEYRVIRFTKERHIPKTIENYEKKSQQFSTLI